MKYTKKTKDNSKKQAKADKTFDKFKEQHNRLNASKRGIKR
ncbi:hypothetical protein [Apilactobacillus apinorum]|uniref:Uncharacterized protein n=1 Tax=Apilactobacillus apinorum TaxID=1218495 RepID=A0ABP9ZJE3_9LACO|nr:hypothetical protein [Apilactobacillus apinorum]CAI2641992.1 hypothetical protein AAPFHON13_04230 [Apilactobacillus apinorum]